MIQKASEKKQVYHRHHFPFTIIDVSTHNIFHCSKLETARGVNPPAPEKISRFISRLENSSHVLLQHYNQPCDICSLCFSEFSELCEDFFVPVCTLDGRINQPLPLDSFGFRDKSADFFHGFPVGNLQRGDRTFSPSRQSSHSAWSMRTARRRP
jgi:hypothetical protein